MNAAWFHWLVIVVLAILTVALACAGADAVSDPNPRRWMLFTACAVVGVVMAYRAVKGRRPPD